MFGSKICLLLALSLAYSAQSQENDFEWLPCLQKALAEGVPSLDFPSKDPWKFNYSRSFDINMEFFHIEISFDADLQCSNVPWWTVTNYTVINSSDRYVEAEYSLHWENVSVDANFIFDDGITPAKSKGNFSTVIEDINWNGSVTLNKATETSPQYLNDLTAHWENEKDIEVYLVIPSVIQATINITSLFNQYLGQLSDDNQLGESVRTYVNDNWLKNTTNYQALMEFCQNN